MYIYIYINIYTSIYIHIRYGAQILFSYRNYWDRCFRVIPFI